MAACRTRTPIYTRVAPTSRGQQQNTRTHIWTRTNTQVSASTFQPTRITGRLLGDVMENYLQRRQQTPPTKKHPHRTKNSQADADIRIIYCPRQHRSNTRTRKHLLKTYSLVIRLQTSFVHIMLLFRIQKIPNSNLIKVIVFYLISRVKSRQVLKTARPAFIAPI